MKSIYISILLLFAAGQIRADHIFIADGSTLNGGHIIRNADKTISDIGEPTSGSGVADGVISFFAANPTFVYSFPDGTVYDYAGGTFSVSGTIGAMPHQTLFAGSILSGQGWTENEQGSVLNGTPMMVIFHAQNLDFSYINPALHLGHSRVAGFQVSQAPKVTTDGSGRAVFDWSQITTYARFDGTFVPEPASAYLVLSALATLVAGRRLRNRRRRASCDCERVGVAWPAPRRAR